MKRFITKESIAIILKLIITALAMGIFSLLVLIYNQYDYMIETAQKYNHENYLAGYEVFSVIERNGLTTTEEINNFYLDKPSGKIDLEMACTDKKIKEKLFEDFGELINAGCRGYTTWELQWEQ